MLDFSGTILLAIAATVLVAAVTATLSGGLTARLLFAGVSGAWIGLVISVVAFSRAGSTLLFGALFFAPLIGVAVMSAMSPAVRTSLASIPLRLVIGLNALRVFGFLFLLLAAAGRLGGPFPYAAGIGDILTGLFAIPIAVLASRASLTDARILAWNGFGLLDLILAVSLGITSANGSPLQLIHAGAGSAAISTLPWAVIPLVLVPMFIVGHIVVFAHVRRILAGQAGHRSRTSAQKATFPTHGQNLGADDALPWRW